MMSRFKQILNYAIKDAKPKTDPCCWLFFMNTPSNAIWKMFLFEEAEEIERLMTPQDMKKLRNIKLFHEEPWMVYHHIFSNKKNWDSARKIAYLKRCKKAGADLSKAVFIREGNDAECLNYLLGEERIQVPEGLLGKYVNGDRIDEDLPTEEQAERLRILFKHWPNYHPVFEDLLFCIEKSNGNLNSSFMFLDVMMECNVDLNFSYFHNILPMICSAFNRSPERGDPAFKRCILNLFEKLLRYGVDPKSALNQFHIRSPRDDAFIHLLCEYGMLTNTTNDEVLVSTRIFEFKSTHPCIHWCSIPPPWSIQRLFWIAYMKEQEKSCLLGSLLPPELLCKIMHHCGDVHLTFSERSCLLRRRKMRDVVVIDV